MERSAQWISVQNTLLVRQMKKPSNLTNKQWSPIKHVLDVMAGFASDEGKDIYPSYKLITQYTGLGERTVYRAIQYLLKEKILFKHQSYSLNLPLIEQMRTVYQTVAKELTVYQTVPTVYQTVNEGDLLSTGQSLLSGRHINKELITISKKTTNNVVAELLKRLIGYGFSEQETNSLIDQFGERHVGGNLAYFELKHQVKPIDNIPAWLRKAFRDNFAKVAAPVIVVPPVSGYPDEPALDALQEFWKSMSREDRLWAIQEADAKRRLFIDLLDNCFEVDGSGKLDYLRDEFCAHWAFKELCRYNLSFQYKKTRLDSNLGDLMPSRPILETPKSDIRQSQAKTLLEIIGNISYTTPKMNGTIL